MDTLIRTRLRRLCPAAWFVCPWLLVLCSCGTTDPAPTRDLNLAPTMTLYNAPPVINHFHLKDTTRAHGEIVSWHADLDDAEGEGANRIGHCNGTMQVTRSNDGHGDDREHRMTTIELDWEDSDDSLLIAGSHPYRHGEVESDTGMIRAVIGGTGSFMGARGQMISERLRSGWYRHTIWLLPPHGRQDLESYVSGPR